MIFLMQYSERMPYGPTSLRFMISVVVMSVSVVSFRVVPTAAEGLTAMSSHLRQAHSSLSIKLTPASDLTVWRRYLHVIPKVGRGDGYGHISRAGLAL